jgi:hypothetical protein
MKTEDCSISLMVDQSPQEVFDAINNVRGWWSEQIEGRNDKVGAGFKYEYQDLHRSTRRITELSVAAGADRPAPQRKSP